MYLILIIWEMSKVAEYATCDGRICWGRGEMGEYVVMSDVKKNIYDVRFYRILVVF